MAEFVNYHRTEAGAVNVSEVIRVIYTTTSVAIGIYQNDDMLVRCACQYVVQLFETEGGQVTVTIERVEMRSQYGVLPYTIIRFAGAGVDRR